MQASGDNGAVGRADRGRRGEASGACSARARGGIISSLRGNAVALGAMQASGDNGAVGRADRGRRGEASGACSARARGGGISSLRGNAVALGAHQASSVTSGRVIARGSSKPSRTGSAYMATDVLTLGARNDSITQIDRASTGAQVQGIVRSASGACSARARGGGIRSESGNEVVFSAMQASGDNGAGGRAVRSRCGEASGACSARARGGGISSLRGNAVALGAHQASSVTSEGVVACCSCFTKRTIHTSIVTYVLVRGTRNLRKRSLRSKERAESYERKAPSRVSHRYRSVTHVVVCRVYQNNNSFLLWMRARRTKSVYQIHSSNCFVWDLKYYCFRNVPHISKFSQKHW